MDDGKWKMDDGRWKTYPCLNLKQLRQIENQNRSNALNDSGYAHTTAGGHGNKGAFFTDSFQFI